MIKVVKCKDTVEISQRTIEYAREGFSCYVDMQSEAAVCHKKVDHELYYTVFLVLEDGSE